MVEYLPSLALALQEILTWYNCLVKSNTLVCLFSQHRIYCLQQRMLTNTQTHPHRTSFEALAILKDTGLVKIRLLDTT